jgi:hypothetical protein
MGRDAPFELHGLGLGFGSRIIATLKLSEFLGVLRAMPSSLPQTGLLFWYVELTEQRSVDAALAALAALVADPGRRGMLRTEKDAHESCDASVLRDTPDLADLPLC